MCTVNGSTVLIFCQDVEIITQRVIIGVFDESLAGKVAEGAECVLTGVEGASAG